MLEKGYNEMLIGLDETQMKQTQAETGEAELLLLICKYL